MLSALHTLHGLAGELTVAQNATPHTGPVVVFLVISEPQHAPRFTQFLLDCDYTGSTTPGQSVSGTACRHSIHESPLITRHACALGHRTPNMH